MFVGKNKLHMLSIAPTTQTPTKKVSNISYLTPFSILRTREYPIVRNIKEIIKYNNKVTNIYFILNNPYFKIQYIALKPSFQPIFFPSSYVRP